MREYLQNVFAPHFLKRSLKDWSSIETFVMEQKGFLACVFSFSVNVNGSTTNPN